MKNKIIKIDDLSEIDTSKVSVYDMNNRYVDPGGNLYGLKYDRFNKKIEIIKILRIHNEDATTIHKEMIKYKMSEMAALTSGEKDKGDSLYDFGTQNDEDEDEFIDIDSYINESIALMATHRSRLKGIINNLKHSNVYPREEKAKALELQEIFRNIEIDAIQKFEKVENYQKELTNYPRSITYYESKMDRRGRECIERIADNNEKKQRFIYFYEMISEIRAVYKILQKCILNLSELVENTDEEKISSKLSHEKQYFKDATTSINNTISEIATLLIEINSTEDNVCSLEYL